MENPPQPATGIPPPQPLLPEACHRAIVESQVELISLARPSDWVLVYVNPACAATYGVAREKLIGRSLLDAVPPAERRAVAARLRQVCDERLTVHSENRIIVADGSTRWVAWTNSVQLDAQGQVVVMQSVGRDITEEVRGREASARLAAMLESSVDAIVSKTLAGVITTWNPAATRLFGYSPAAVIGRSILLTVPPDRVAEMSRLLARVRAGEPVIEFETVRRRADGGLMEVSLTLSPIRDAAGQVVGVSKTARDIGERKRLERALSASEHQYRALYESTPAMLQSIDAEGRLLSVSDAWLAHLGYRRDEVIGRRSVGFLTPASREFALRQVLPALLQEGRNHGIAYQMVRRDGSVVDVRLSSVFERDGHGQPLRSMAVIEDVTEPLRLRRVLEQEHERLRVTLHSIADAVITTDTTGCVDYLNPVAETLTGWRLADAVGLPIEQVFNVVHESLRRPVPNPVRLCLAEGHAVGLVQHSVLIARDGREYGVEDSAAPMRDADARLMGAVLVFRDVTSQRRMASEMRYRATHDALTGLVNRAEFEERLHRTLAQLRIDGGPHALLYIDLDQFKLVNDACGHSAGDLLLKQISALLQRSVRGRDTLARLGGDEFGVILEHCRIEQAERVAQQICDQMDEFRFVHEERRFRLGASIGLVPLDTRWVDSAALMQAADSSCLAAKTAGRNRVHTWLDSDRQLQANRGEAQWASRIDSALEENRLLLYAQRINAVAAAEPRARQPLHVEVLLRLCDVDGSIIAPGAFLPAAERFHLACRIDRWVLRAVLAWLARHRTRLNDGDLLAVNLSGQSLSDKAFHRYAAELIDAHAGLARHLCLEVTETAAITHLLDATGFITEVRQRGVRVALDDFGAGASSFGYLKSLPVDFLKIDGQFIRGLGSDPLDMAAVRSFCDVAAVVGVKTVAEFVENAATFDELRRIGVDYAQGYLLHRPQPLDALLADLTA